MDPLAGGAVRDPVLRAILPPPPGREWGENDKKRAVQQRDTKDA